MHEQDFFKCVSDYYTLAIALGVKYSGDTSFNDKHMLYFTQQLSSKPKITIVNKVFCQFENPRSFLK